MTSPTASQFQHHRAVRLWLMVVAAFLVLIVLVGGATRLTESGLSIVEWKPVTGTLPPLSDQAWNDAFEAYKAIPQYREINRGMSLSDFKTIFWWEWSHRLLGRIIGVVFLLPFVWFLWRGSLPKQIVPRLWIVFGLGGLQGVIGWWMVASGLAGRTEVSHYRLALHLMLALIILTVVVWTLRQLTPRRELIVTRRIRIGAQVLLGLIFVQIYFGALVAGLRAGRIYTTWPLIDGAFIPDAARLFFNRPWWINVFDNALTVQFCHRMLAYAIWLGAVLHVVDVVRARVPSPTLRGAVVLALLITAQAMLGIVALVNAVPISLGLIHQGMAVMLLIVAVVHAQSVSPRAAVEARWSGVSLTSSAGS